MNIYQLEKTLIALIDALENHSKMSLGDFDQSLENLCEIAFKTKNATLLNHVISVIRKYLGETK